MPPGGLEFDLIAVDKGSQGQVGEVAIPPLRLADGGAWSSPATHLPPIVEGSYPGVEDEPLLHRSILEAIRYRYRRRTHHIKGHELAQVRRAGRARRLDGDATDRCRSTCRRAA